MARSARSTVILGAATALALATAGWLTAGAAAADDTPPPVDPASPTAEPTTDPAPPVEGSVDDPAPTRTPDPTGAPKPPVPDGYTVPKIPAQLASAGTQEGNSFSHPIHLSGYYPFPVNLDNTAATTQSGEPRRIQGGWYLTRTQWLKWKAPGSGVVSLEFYGTSSTDDVGINVYTGSAFSNLHRVKSNDQNYLPVDGAATVSGSPANSAAIQSLKVSKGHTYYFQVGSATPTSSGVGAPFDTLTFWITGGNYSISNDNLASAKELKLGTGAFVSVDGILGGADLETWEPIDNDEDSSAIRTGSIWYKWIAPSEGTAQISNCAFLDPGVAIDVFGETQAGSGFNSDMPHRAFDYGGYSGCNTFFGGGTVNVSFVKGERIYIQTAETLGSDGRDVSTEIQATFTDPYIEKLNHTSGKIGRTITITGQALNTGGSPTVKFGSKTATIVGIPTATSIVVKAPTNPLGKVSVTVTSGGDTSNKKSFTYTLV